MFGYPGNSLFRRSRGGLSVAHPSGLAILLAPLGARDATVLAAHLRRLSPQDRQTRFFHLMSDAAIDRYVERIDWAGAFLFGLRIEGTLRGVGELGADGEIAVTVEEGWRHLALGRVLVAALLVAAKAQGLRSATLFYLNENAPMRALASDLGARLSADHGVTEARVPVGP